MLGNNVILSGKKLQHGHLILNLDENIFNWRSLNCYEGRGMKGLIGWQLKFDIYNFNVWFSLSILTMKHLFVFISLMEAQETRVVIEI